MLTSRKTNCGAKLADFGLAETVKNATLKSGSKAGTVGYVAPEISEGTPYGISSDIWSLGCLLYAMLTVSLPFPTWKRKRSEPGSPQKRSKVTTVDYSQLNLDNIMASDACKDLISRMLVREPNMRLTIE